MGDKKVALTYIPVKITLSLTKLLQQPITSPTNWNFDGLKSLFFGILINSTKDFQIDAPKFQNQPRVQKTSSFIFIHFNF